MYIRHDTTILRCLEGWVFGGLGEKTSLLSWACLDLFYTFLYPRQLLSGCSQLRVSRFPQPPQGLLFAGQWHSSGSGTWPRGQSCNQPSPALTKHTLPTWDTLGVKEKIVINGLPSKQLAEARVHKANSRHGDVLYTGVETTGHSGGIAYLRNFPGFFGKYIHADIMHLDLENFYKILT